jgi:hypothetical protein
MQSEVTDAHCPPSSSRRAGPELLFLRTSPWTIRIGPAERLGLTRSVGLGGSLAPTAIAETGAQGISIVEFPANEIRAGS